MRRPVRSADSSHLSPRWRPSRPGHCWHQRVAAQSGGRCPAATTALQRLEVCAEGALQGADLLLENPAELGSLEAGAELWAQLLRLPIF